MANFADHVRMYLGMMHAENVVDLNELEEVGMHELGIAGEDWAKHKYAPKACYNNAFDFLCEHVGDDVKYVVGYGLMHIPIDHAWVKVGDKYHDPSWEVNSPIGVLDRPYVPLFEMGMAELIDVIRANGMKPPSVVDMLNYENDKLRKGAA